MLHLRIVSPQGSTPRVLEVLEGTESVCNIIVLEAAARRPSGDVLLCDVPREDASVVLADLRGLGIHHDGSVAVEAIETELSDGMERALQAARGAEADAVVWEEVTKRTSESSELSVSFALFMVLAALLAAVGILLDSPVLVVGAMVVGPEFGPIAGICVAALQRRGDMAARSAAALGAGFPLAILSVVVAMLIFRATGLVSEDFDTQEHAFAELISSPDFFSFFVAFCAGIVGMLSLTTAKSAALVGGFISITTIPAAANAGVAAAYGDWTTVLGSLGQLLVNLAAIIIAGLLTLVVERRMYERRRRRHLRALRRSTDSRATAN
ncbi:MAG TPA: DUF389 domain-containing protein [Solirubrobacteraceae bacterium]|nr:DUF389 domain-containing protein [Solirubrobacteraceae bacterium]